jgi:hypothetical protein
LSKYNRNPSVINLSVYQNQLSKSPLKNSPNASGKGEGKKREKQAERQSGQGFKSKKGEC